VCQIPHKLVQESSKIVPLGAPLFSIAHKFSALAHSLPYCYGFCGDRANSHRRLGRLVAGPFFVYGGKQHALSINLVRAERVRGRLARRKSKIMKTVLLGITLVASVLFPTCPRCAPAKPGLEVVVLGSGGPRPFGRAGSSFIILLDGTPRILVDAGPGAFLRIGELDLDLDKVDTVLLTHLHIDHSGDLAAFFNARALSADGPVVYHIFGPDGAGLFPKTSRFVDLLVGKGGAFEYQKTFGADESFKVRDLAITLDSPRTKIVEENGLVVEEIATHHGDCPSVAYRISYKGAVLVFSGDMDASALPNLVQLAKNADLLIFNCAVLDPPNAPSQLYDLHTPPKKIGEAAHESGVKSLLLSHLAPDVESQEDAVRKSIRASYAGPVAFASDKLHVPVGQLAAK
jgi:ribonuclease BN (tRNA processing enzyme)